MADAQDAAILRKVALRFLPLLITAYIVNYIDRTSLGVGALTMNRDLGLTPSQYGWAAGVFFAGYCLFEIPSNLALYRFGARKWLARIMITWGIASALTAFVTGPISFVIVRFLLGVAEAGFFPGVAYFLACWFPKAYRARVLAWFLIAIPLSSVIGTPLSGALLEMDGIWGFAGWQWMFILISLPAVVLGVVVLRVLCNTPAEATWLTPIERARLAQMLDEPPVPHQRTRVLEAFADTRVLILAGIQFGLIVGSYGIGLWLPQIIKTEALTNFETSMLSTLPYVVATIGALVWAYVADKRASYLNNIAIALLLAAVALLPSLVSASASIGLAGITLSLLGINAARALFWSVPTRFLSGAAAAGGLAFINSIGTIGGFVGPPLVGILRESTGGYAAGFGAIAGFLFLSTLLTLLLRHLSRANTVREKTP